MRGRDQTVLTDLIKPEDQAIEAVVSRYQRVAPAVTRFARSLSKNPNLRVRLGSEPSASSDEVVGPHGDLVRVRVSAPPEGGRANRAVTDLLAARLAVPRASVSVVKGHASPRKTVFVAGLALPAALARLAGGPP